MTISPAHLEDFKKLYKARYRADLSNQEALEYGSKLLRLMASIYQPITEKERRKVLGTSNHNV